MTHRRVLFAALLGLFLLFNHCLYAQKQISKEKKTLRLILLLNNTYAEVRTLESFILTTPGDDTLSTFDQNCSKNERLTTCFINKDLKFFRSGEDLSKPDIFTIGEVTSTFRFIWTPPSRATLSIGIEEAILRSDNSWSTTGGLDPDRISSFLTKLKKADR